MSAPGEPLALTALRPCVHRALEGWIPIPPLIEIITQYSFSPRIVHVLPLVPASELDLKIGASIDARDRDGRWCKAVVVRVSTSAIIPTTDSDGTTEACERAAIRYVRVHFRGWQAKWDEWISLLPTVTNPLRLQPDNRFTSEPAHECDLGPQFVKHGRIIVYQFGVANRNWVAVLIGDQIGYQIRPIDASGRATNWCHAASDEIWQSDEYPNLESTPIPPSATHDSDVGLSVSNSMHLSIAESAEEAISLNAGRAFVRLAAIPAPLPPNEPAAAAAVGVSAAAGPTPATNPNPNAASCLLA